MIVYPAIYCRKPDVIMKCPPGRVAQLVGHLTRKSGVLGWIPGLATYFRSPSAFSRRAVVSYWRKYVHEVLVNRLGGLSLPRKIVVRLTDCPDMTLDVYCGRKTTIQQQQQQQLKFVIVYPAKYCHKPDVIMKCLTSVCFGCAIVLFKR